MVTSLKLPILSNKGLGPIALRGPESWDIKTAYVSKFRNTRPDLTEIHECNNSWEEAKACPVTQGIQH